MSIRSEMEGRAGEEEGIEATIVSEAIVGVGA
jgi:hypothetical protein